MRNAMRWLSAIMMIVILLHPGIVQAASMPIKSGVVQDTAKMIPKESIPYIERAAKGNPYTFYLLTINSLNGQNAAEYATAVYRKWKLTADDILIVLSKEDRRVEMNFNNPALQEKIDALPDDFNGDGQSRSKLSEFVDRHFIPKAKEGNFARAAITLIEATKQLKPAAIAIPEDPTGNLPSDKHPNTSNSDSGAPIKPQEPAGPGAFERFWNGIPWPTVGVIAGIIALCIPLCIWIWRLQRLRKLRNQIPVVMAAVSHALERVRHYAELYQGTTQQEASSIEGQLTSSLIELDSSLKELQQISFVRTMLPTLKKQLDSAENVRQTKENEVAELSRQIEQIESIERQLVDSIREARTRLQQLEYEYRSETNARGWSLDGIEQRHHDLVNRTQTVDDMDTFDPIGANAIMDTCKTGIEQLSQDISSISHYANLYQQFPNEMASSRSRFESIVQEHRLKLIRIDPYGCLEQARDTNERMLEQLQIGNISEVAQLAEHRRQLLAEAVQMTQRIADLKLKNAEDIQAIAKRLSNFMDQERQMNELHNRVTHTYRSTYWEHAWELYHNGLPEIAQMRSRLNDVRSLSSEEVQEYELARQELDGILQALQDQDRNQRQYEGLVTKLDQAVDLINRQLKSGEQAFSRGRDVIARNRLVQVWGPAETSLLKLDSGLKQLIAQPPYDIDFMSELSSRYVREAEAYLQDVERTAILKRDAERNISDMEARYRSTYNRTRRKIKLSHFDYQYSQVISNANDYMQRGDYQRASQEAAMLAGIINAMNAAYDAVLAEERRREEARRAEERRREEARRAEERRIEEEKRRREQANSSSSGSWGGSSNSSSSNSSGGSSWGSSSNSSGGSSWDSSNKNSSGGSNW
ncbi:TPM domain-containing protein [Paenibacillus alvei]|uniref:TPM domain-containing protein n=1 Tax=Paenibacillus alvei TaxID=44250 RepID=UPI0013DD8323